MDKTVKAQLKCRHDTAANWTAKNPVLLDGELGAETDTTFFKIGDGATAWTSLKYVTSAQATKATQDASGNVITTTYAKKSEIPSVPVKGVKISGSTSNLTTDTSGIVTIPAIPTKVSTFTNDSGYLTTHQDLSGYQTKLTFDSTPTANSSNPVTSDGIKKAIDTAVSTSKTEIEEKIPAVTVSGNTISFGSVTIGVD